MFSTYAVPMILGEIKRHLRDDGRVKVSRQIKQEVRNMRKAYEEFRHIHGRSPKLSELAEQMEISVGRASSFNGSQRCHEHSPESLDDPERTETMAESEYREQEERRIDMIYLKSAIRQAAGRASSHNLALFQRHDSSRSLTGWEFSQVQVSRIEKRYCPI